MSMITVPADAASEQLTERVRATWMAGDFGRIATGYEAGAAEFIARLELARRESVLDVACGTGNLALPAARAGAAVSGIDIAPNLLVQLAGHARAEGLDIELTEGNCEAMPYADASFDTVVSMFGVMFAARPDRAAAELLRVCRPGGRIVLANWTAAGFIGQMFKRVAQYAPPPADVPSPLQWGTEDGLMQRFGPHVTLQLTARTIRFEYPLAPVQVVDLFSTWYGPAKRAFDSLDDGARAQLHGDLTHHWSAHNQAADGGTLVESEYLEVVVIRR
jgi:SAM-dependent methyltransferase